MGVYNTVLFSTKIKSIAIHYCCTLCCTILQMVHKRKPAASSKPARSSKRNNPGPAPSEQSEDATLQTALNECMTKWLLVTDHIAIPPGRFLVENHTDGELSVTVITYLLQPCQTRSKRLTVWYGYKRKKNATW